MGVSVVEAPVGVRGVSFFCEGVEGSVAELLATVRPNIEAAVPTSES